MFLGMGAWALALLTGMATAVDVGAGLRLEAATPSDPCPDLSIARAALRAHLGGVVVPEGGAAWRVRYATFGAPEREGGRVLRLEILDPTGELDRRRDIPMAGASCEALAEAIAVVVETRFREPAAAAQPGEAQRPIEDVRVVAPRAAERAVAPRWSLRAAAATATPGPHVGFGLGGTLRVARRAALGLDVGLPARAQAEALDALMPGATASSRGVPARAAIVYTAAARERLRVDVGPEALVEVDRAEVAGLATSKQGTRVIVGAGATAIAALRLVGGLALTGIASVDGTLPLAASQFVVQSPRGEVEVLRQPWLVARLGVGLAYESFP
jgi:hypothetical protein